MKLLTGALALCALMLVVGCNADKAKDNPQEAATDMADKAKKAMEKAGETVKEGMEKAGEAAKEGIEKAQEGAEKIKEEVKEGAEKVKEGVKEGAEKVEEKASEAAAALKTKFTELVGSAQKGIEGLPSLTETPAELKAAVEKLLENMKLPEGVKLPESAQAVVDSIQTKLGELQQMIADSKAKEELDAKVQEIQEAAKGLKEDLIPAKPEE